MQTLQQFTLAEPVRENRLRRMAKRQGLRLRKSRDDGYMIVDPSINAVVCGGSPIPFCLSLDDVEEWLMSLDQL